MSGIARLRWRYDNEYIHECDIAWDGPYMRFQLPTPDKLGLPLNALVEFSIEPIPDPCPCCNGTGKVLTDWDRDRSKATGG